MIKFLRSVQGFGYFEGDVGTLPAGVEAKLVTAGYAIIVPDTEGTKNLLPETMPARELLFDNGLETIEDVRNALPSITDLKGIGKKAAEQITKYLSELVVD